MSHFFRNQAIEFNIEKAICGDLSSRIIELFPLGISKIWMKGTGIDRYHITNILGISSEVWDEAIPFSGLHTRENKLKANCDTDWTRKLNLTFQFRSFRRLNESKYFRFI